MIIATYRIADYNRPDNNEGRYLDRESVKKYLSSPSFKEMISKRLIWGSLSHKVREDINEFDSQVTTNDQDIMLYEKRLANILIDAWENEDGFFGKLLIPDTDEGILAQTLLCTETYLSVSMHVRVMKNDNKWELVELKGVDFTTDPAFPGSELVSYEKGVKSA